MRIIMLFLILASIPNSVFAAELVEGVREGKIKFHDEEFVPATFVIRSIKKDDEPSYRIEMIQDERLYDFEQLTFDSKEMMFVLDTGQKYNCVLSLDEKAKNNVKDCKGREGYCGVCIHLTDDEKRKLIIINIRPPQVESESPEQDSAEVEGESSD